MKALKGTLLLKGRIVYIYSYNIVTPMNPPDKGGYFIYRKNNQAWSPLSFEEAEKILFDPELQNCSLVYMGVKNVKIKNGI